jgi:lysine 2,3-aminomutase
VIDGPKGGGKIPIMPNYVVSHSGKTWVLRNYAGKQFTYEEP